MVLGGMFKVASNIRQINKKYFAPTSGVQSGKALRSFVMGTSMALTFFFTYSAGVCVIFSVNPYKTLYGDTRVEDLADCTFCN